MSYWLIKSEPTQYAFSDLQEDERTRWDGISNNAALMHIRAMKPGDLAFFYHSGKEKSVVGIVKIVSAPYADPASGDPKRVVFDVEPGEQLKQPVSLSDIKQRKDLSTFALVRQPRLSVMPVSREHWELLLRMSH